MVQSGSALNFYDHVVHKIFCTFESSVFAKIMSAATGESLAIVPTSCWKSSIDDKTALVDFMPGFD